MADEKEINKKEHEPKVIDTTKRVKLIALKDAPYHQEGEIFEAAVELGELMIKNKWAKKHSE